MTIFTGPSSTMITRVICEGSAIDANRLRTSTRSKCFAALQPRGDGVDRRRVERHADAGRPRAGAFFVRRRRCCPGSGSRRRFQRRVAGRVLLDPPVRTTTSAAHIYLMPILLVTLGTR